MLFAAAAQERTVGGEDVDRLGSGPLSLWRQRSPNESEENNQVVEKGKPREYISADADVSIGKRRYTLRQS